MKTTNEIKKWLKENLGLTVKGNTLAGRGQWQCLRIPPDSESIRAGSLTYSLPMFPPEFTQMCIKIVYPNSPELHQQTSVNNIDRRHVDMQAPDWDAAIAEWERTHPKTA